jgi:hypothetical protein
MAGKSAATVDATTMSDEDRIAALENRVRELSEQIDAINASGKLKTLADYVSAIDALHIAVVGVPVGKSQSLRDE